MVERHPRYKLYFYGEGYVFISIEITLEQTRNLIIFHSVQYIFFFFFLRFCPIFKKRQKKKKKQKKKQWDIAYVVKSETSCRSIT